jgi:hypothetical protein
VFRPKPEKRLSIDPEEIGRQSPDCSQFPADKRRELVKDLRLAPAWMHAIFCELANG